MTNESASKRVEFSPIFTKKLEQVSPEIQVAVRETLELFLENPSHPSLRNHRLAANYTGIRSVDISNDWRALYREEPERIIFIELGTHEELYG